MFGKALRYTYSGTTKCCTGCKTKLPQERGSEEHLRGHVRDCLCATGGVTEREHGRWPCTECGFNMPQRRCHRVISYVRESATHGTVHDEKSVAYGPAPSVASRVKRHCPGRPLTLKQGSTTHATRPAPEFIHMSNVQRAFREQRSHN